MRKALSGFSLVLLALALPRLLAEDTKPAPLAKVSDLAWLAGHWRGTLANGASFESHYTGPDGGMIASVSKEVKRDRVASFELETFFEKDGQLIYHPYPYGKKSEHAFPLLSYNAAAKRAVFENKEHDYPQSFTFEQPAPDRLVITLSGSGKNGQKKDIVYELKRVLAASIK